jgi:CheY-like chemotaxis protein
MLLTLLQRAAFERWSTLVISDYNMPEMSGIELAQANWPRQSARRCLW